MGSILSTKGQLVIPKEVREAKHWTPGHEFDFEITEEGVLIKPKAQQKLIPMEKVFGAFAHLAKQPPPTEEEMREGVLKMAAASYTRSMEK